MDKKALLKAAADSIIEADQDRAMEIVAEAEASGMDLIELLSDGFAAGMREFGDMFSEGTVFLPELIFTSEIMKAVSEKVESKLDQGSVRKKGVIVIGTVAGDVHDIGKGIVASLLKSGGMDVHDIGRDVPAEEFIKRAKEIDADFIGSSALLTTTMTEQKHIEELLKEAGLRDKVKTVIGGAPVTARWAEKIGADKYCEDATEAVNFINECFKEVK